MDSKSESSTAQAEVNKKILEDGYDEQLLQACIEAEKEFQARDETCDTCRWREWCQWRAVNGATLLEALLLIEFAALERVDKGQLT